MALTDVLRPRLVEVGKIKIGGLGAERTAASGRKYRTPLKLDHFVITTLHRTAAGDLQADDALMRALIDKGYGDEDGQLRQLPITLLSDDPEDVMQAAYCWYGSKRIAARSDGEMVTWYADPVKNALLPEPRQETWRPEMLEMRDKDGNALFKIHAVFNCVLATGEGRWGGVYKFRTTSRITADQLYGSLVQLRQLTSGVLRGLPLMLVVRPMTVTPQDKATTVYVVHVELRGADLQKLHELAREQLQFQVANAKQIHSLQIEYQRLLRAPGEGEDEDEIREVQEEFHPEVTETVPPAPDTRSKSERLAERLAPPAEPEPTNGGAALTPAMPAATTVALARQLMLDMDKRFHAGAGTEALAVVCGEGAKFEELAAVEMEAFVAYLQKQLAPATKKAEKKAEAGSLL